MSNKTGGSGDVDLVRSIKSSAIEVVDYEIAMLRYCFAGLYPTQPADSFAKNVLLEAYLLHYRGLLEFFAQPLRSVRRTDLTIRRPEEWATRTVTDAEIATVTSLAEPLHTQWFDLIGKQLAHCTQPRYLEKQTWPIKAMNDDMEQIIDAFNQLGKTASYR